MEGWKNGNVGSGGLVLGCINNQGAGHMFNSGGDGQSDRIAHSVFLAGGDEQVKVASGVHPDCESVVIEVEILAFKDGQAGKNSSVKSHIAVFPQDDLPSQWLERYSLGRAEFDAVDRIDE